MTSLLQENIYIKNDDNVRADKLEPKITILIPAHNEETRIGATLEDYSKFFDNVEILVTMDGCNDKTLDIVKIFSENGNGNGNYIRYIHSKERLGKGGGFVQGFRHAKGDIVAVTDADGSISPKEILKLINQLDGSECIIWSRWLPESILSVKQPLRRRVASRSFNMFVRILLGLSYRDTQCGAKVFKRYALESTVDAMSTFNFAFDVDLLYQFHKKNFKIKEIPIAWDDKDGSSVKLFRTSIIMFLSIVRLRIVHSPFRFIIKNYMTNYIYKRIRR